jgi:magnesium transporter
MRSLESLIRVFVELHPEEAARALEALDYSESAQILERLPVSIGAQLIQQLSPHLAGPILQGLGAERTGELLADMTPRQACTVLQHLEENTRDQVLRVMPAPAATQLRDLLSFPADTAGGMMEPRVTTLPLDLTVQEAITSLRRAPRSTLYYLYVTDRDRRLVGVLNLRDLLLSGSEERIEPLVRQPVVSVPADLDRDEVVDLIRERGFLALPVVDQEGRLIGVVRHDEAMEAGQEAAFEDLQITVGAGADEEALSPVFTVVGRRLPWLYVNLLTAFIAAGVVGLFEGIIAQVTALAVLLPVVAGQGGNCGAQALAIVIRGLALDEIVPGTRRRVLLKEALAGTLNGLAVAVVTALAVLAWSRSYGLALVIGLAMIVNMAAAALAGALIPLILSGLGRDPAQSSTIFLTTVTDVVGFASFLGFAVLFAPLLVTS